jgi:hypothetical protein
MASYMGEDALLISAVAALWNASTTFRPKEYACQVYFNKHGMQVKANVGNRKKAQQIDEKCIVGLTLFHARSPDRYDNPFGPLGAPRLGCID